MLENWSATALLVHLAALTYVAGFLIRNQLLLRGLILIGTILYIAYYYLEPQTPLWDAIGWSIVMGFANAFTMTRMILDGRGDRDEGDGMAVHHALREMTPGDLRRVMSLAEESTASIDTVVIEPGTVPVHLYFVISGEILLKKHNAGNVIGFFGRSQFVGECSYVLNRAASAKVILGAGSHYLRWNVADLRALSAKTESVRSALASAFSRDLAMKEAIS